MGSFQGQHFQKTWDAIQFIETQDTLDGLKKAVGRAVEKFGYQYFFFASPFSKNGKPIRDRQLLNC